VGTLYYMSPEQLQAQAKGEEIGGEERAFLCNVTTRRARVSRFDHRA
jgi:hypothetical protein